MCGRYTHLYTWKQVYRLMGINTPTPAVELRLSWNVAPTQLAPLVVGGCGWAGEGHKPGLQPGPVPAHGVLMKWGFAVGDGPAGGRGPRLAPINARGETVASLPMFRDAFERTRCVVPISGFYEWMPLESGVPNAATHPYYIRVPSREVLLLAGIWTGPADRTEEGSFAILTTQATSAMQQLHDRMPIMLDEATWPRWLAPGAVEASFMRSLLLAPAPADLVLTPVSPRVNKPSHNDPGLIERVEPPRVWNLFGGS